MKKIWNGIKRLLLKTSKWIRLNWTLAVAFFFTYIVPVIMLSELMVFVKDVPAGKKITVMGCIAIGALFLIFRKKVKELIIRMHKGWIRAILRIIMAGIFWSFMYGLFYGVQYIAGALQQYWIRVGVCMVIGYTFYFIDEIKKRKRSNNDIANEN